MSNSFSPLFATGTARGGTGIFVQTLSAHSSVEIALDPSLSIYKSFRDSLLKSSGLDRDLRESHPFYDYLSPSDSDLFNLIQGSEFDSFALSTSQLNKIRHGVSNRSLYDAPDLSDISFSINGLNHKQVLFSLLSLIVDKRSISPLNTLYSGIHENWIIEFLPSLARTFLNAKFLIILRDPRAVIASHDAASAELRTSILSFLRSIRKLHNLAASYLSLPLFSGRLCVVKYESLLLDPQKTSQILCDFLNIPYEDGMIDPKNHLEPGKSTLRDGVSSFEKNATGYKPERITRWKNHLVGDRLSLVNALMHPFLHLFGYSDMVDQDPCSIEFIKSTLIKDNEFTSTPKWSIDNLNPDIDSQYEFNRLIALARGYENNPSLNDYFLLDNYPNFKSSLADHFHSSGIWFS